MTDLHCHLLPQMDDGAKDMESAKALLQAEKENNITQVALTSHYNCDKETTNAFLLRREKAFELFQKAAGEDFFCKLGAEVYFSPRILDLEFEKLCLQGTPYMLIELPVTYYPEWTKNVFYQLQIQGVVPILAHIERYPYIMKNPNILYDLIQMGTYTHINASSLMREPKRTKQILKFMQAGYIHAVASDAHSVHRRPPMQKTAFEIITKALGADMTAYLQQNADLLFKGEDPEIIEITAPRRFLGRVCV